MKKMITIKILVNLIISLLLCLSISGCFAAFVPEKEKLLTEGRYSEASSVIEKEIESNKDISNADLISLCHGYSQLKKYNQLFSTIERLEKNIKSGKKIFGGTVFAQMYVPGIFDSHSDVTPLPHIFRAQAYLELGNLYQALEEAKKAYEAVEVIGDRVNKSFIRFAIGDKPQDSKPGYISYRLHTLSLLGVSYALSGDKQKAYECIDKLKNQEIGFVSAAPLNKQKVLAINKVYVALNDFHEILKNQKGFFDAFSGIGYVLVGYDIFINVDLPRRFIIAKALMETGSIKEAKIAYNELLSDERTVNHGEIYWNILFDLGQIAEREKDTKAATSFYKKAIDVVENQRSTINQESARIGFVGDKQRLYNKLILLLYSLGDFKEAFEYAERAKSRALVDLLASKKEFGNMSTNARYLLHEMEGIEIKNINLSSDNVSTKERFKSQARGIEVKRKLLQEAPGLATLVTVTSFPANEIQSKLKLDETLIEYYYYHGELLAFVVTNSDLKAFRLRTESLPNLVEGLRKSIQNPSSTDYKMLSSMLYNTLIGPLESYIKTKHLIIVPHDVLHYLPFTALINNETALVDRYAIRLLPSASIIRFLQKHRMSKDKNILILGNPDLGNPQFDLKYASEEAAFISALYPNSKLYLRKDANKKIFLKEAPNFHYIHLATHGVFKQDSPLNSGFLLASHDGLNGFVSVDEIFLLDLNADLVTLSACETGLGKIRSGDDVIGLVRAFLYAGANSIIASLWKVDDLATAQLMTEFYKNIKDMDKDEALKNAQQKIKTKYEHPYYWASFQLIGDRESK